MIQLIQAALTKILGLLFAWFGRSNSQNSGWAGDVLKKVTSPQKTTVEYLQDGYLKYGGEWHPEFNIFGIRSEGDPILDVFDDYIGVAYLDPISKQWQWRCYRGTTDPGKTFILSERTDGGQGANFMALGFQKNIWQIGAHRGPKRPDGSQFIVDPALIALGAAQKVWKDKNRNGKRDLDEKEVMGWQSLNCHPAGAHYTGKSTELVGAYSAGCQVIQARKNWDEFIGIVLRTETIRKNRKAKISYMLFAKNWLPSEFWIAA
jgi:hypothetical protein